MRKWFVIALLLVCSSLFAIEPRIREASLDAKAVALPPLKPLLDNAKINLYLASPTWSAWNLAHGGNWTAQFDTLTNRPRRVFGGAIPWTKNPAQLESVARAFIDANPSLFGATNTGLTYDPTGATAVRSGRVMYAAFDYKIAGIPVEHARLVFAVNNGNLIYWHSANIANVPAITTPLLSASQALTATLVHAGVTQSAIDVLQEPKLKFLPMNGPLGTLLTYRLTYELAFRLDGGRSTWVAHVDALTGAVIAFGDSNRYAACTAGTGGKVVGGVKPAQATDTEIVRSFPFAEVNGGESANANGSFVWGGGKASTGLNGTFFDTSCEDCVKSEADPQAGFQPYAESTNGLINLGTGGRDVVLGPDQPTTSYGNGTSTPADRTAFFHTNVARMIALKWMNLPWLDTKVPVKVNINDVCNAFWDGSSLNFFKAGELASGSSIIKCRNTGEIRDVMQHEWGHGLDDNDGEDPGYAAGLGDMATGEAVADHVALFVDHDACVGQSFYNSSSGPYVTDPVTGAIADCDGVRNLDEHRTTTGRLTTTNVTTTCAAVTTSPYYIGPLLGEGHCEGELWGQVSWHLAYNLETGRKYGTVTLDANKQHRTFDGDTLPAGNPGFGRDVAWTILEQLYFESRPVVASYAPSRFQVQGVSAYDGFMIADDEGDGLANGTPHAAYINDAYVHHGNEEWAPGTTSPSVAVDAKNCTAPGTPAVTLAQATHSPTGTPSITISWTSVPGATSYSVLRTERRDDVFLEVARVTTGNSVTDIGIDNGVTYYYRVQANRGGGCFAVSSGGVQSITVSQPAPAINNIVITDLVGGNSDGDLDPGEQATLFIALRNHGLGALTNVSATLRSVTTGVVVISSTPSTYGSIAAGAVGGPDQSFGITIDTDGSLCGSALQLVLDVTSDQGCFAVPVTLPLDDSLCSVFADTYVRPESIVIDNDSLTTCGDGDGVPDPGETLRVTVTVKNRGDRAATNARVGLAADHPALMVLTDTVNVGSLAVGASSTASFTVSVGSAPHATDATFTATSWSTERLEPAARALDVVVNRDLVTTTHLATFDGSNDGWMPEGLWARGLAPTTGNLTTVFHSGYTADQCDTLTSGEMEFSANSAMSFDLAYVTEGTPVEGFLDGLDIQITLDGGQSWHTLPLTQGYAGVSASTSCVGAGSPMFAGVSPLMTRFDADLSAYAGRKGQIRFRFGSDPLVEAGPAGAWVDNVTTSNIIVSVPDTSCQ
ncbi:MAG TPA: CARDB domain-containing protein [Thermoanaerobaculia bacterium]|nr:CARDB domain-containing protein [Thermoanaerobaculia bacterium]